MDVNEFERILQIGLGRTVIHLQNNTAPYHDALLNACLHSTVYDRQSEGSKAVYLFDCIHLMENPSFFIEQIKQKAAIITSETDADDVQHLLDMLTYLARNGDRDAAQLIHAIFLKTRMSDVVHGAKHIVQLFGVRGFLFVAENLGKIMLSDASFKHSDGQELLGRVHYTDNRGQIDSILAEKRQDNREVDVYLTSLEYETAQTNRLKERIKQSSYAELKEIIVQNDNLWLADWAQQTTAQELQEVAHDFVNTSDEKMLKALASIFQWQPFPLAPELLFKYADSPVNYLRNRIFSVYRKIDNPIMREFASQLIIDGRNVGEASRILAKYFEPNDWQIYTELFDRGLSDDDLHGLQIAVRNTAEQYPSQFAKSLLLNLYEYAPCSFCRKHIVELLDNMSKLTEEIRQECLHDSWLETREMAQHRFTSHN
ncbi:MAG: hypothetical protein AAFV93_09030 [Chloroflexota bacterium]